MAQKSAFSPEFIQKLATKKRFVESGAKAVSEMTRFPGPDDRYFARLVRIVGRHDSKDGSLIVVFNFVTLAAVTSGNQDFGNFPVRIQFYCRESKHQSEQEAWNRLYTDGYQLMGIQTQAWTNPNEQMVEATDLLNTVKPPVILDIRVNANDPRYHNVRIMEVLKEKAVSHFVQAAAVVSDEDLIKAAEDEQAASTDAVPINFTEELKGLVTKMADLDHKTLADDLTENGIDFSANHTADDLRMIMLYAYCKGRNEDPAAYNITLPPTPGLEAGQQSFGIVPSSALVPTSGSGTAPFGTEEDDDEEPTSPESTYRAKVATMDREQLKAAIVTLDVTRAKFKKSMSDDVFRDILIDIARLRNWAV